MNRELSEIIGKTHELIRESRELARQTQQLIHQLQRTARDREHYANAVKRNSGSGRWGSEFQTFGAMEAQMSSGLQGDRGSAEIRKRALGRPQR